MRPLGAALAACTLAAGVTGCGDDEFANAPRPPAPIVVSTAITADRISVSPDRFGAGPVNLIITNQTDATQRISLDRPSEGRSSGDEVDQQTGPINPGDTASVKLDLEEGTYTLSVGGDSIEPATIEVQPQRRSAQDELMQP